MRDEFKNIKKAVGPCRFSTFSLQPSSFDKGFTLLELLVVIFILSLFAAVVFPSFYTLDADIVKSEAKEIASVLRYLNDSALATKETYSLKIDFQERVLSWKGPDGERTKTMKSLESIELPSRGKIQEGQVILFFGPLGIQESVILSLHAKNEEMRVEFNQLSGRVRIKG